MHKNFVKIENIKDWQNLLGKVLFKTFFHNTEWEEFLEKQFKWLKFERYIWMDQVLLSLARVGKKLISHPFCEYGGPLPLIEKIDGEEFQKDLFEEFKTPFKISFHPKVLDYFEGIEFPENQRETYFFENLDSKTEEDIWQLMDRNRHRSIKEAQDRSFKIRKCENIGELKKLYDFYVKNLKKHRAIPYPFSFFEFFLNSVKAEVMMVDRNGIAGGNIFLLYPVKSRSAQLNWRSHYLTGQAGIPQDAELFNRVNDKIIHSFLCGFDDVAKIESAHSLVLWEEIKKAKKMGCLTFDFGATRKDSSIKDFKERWGARACPIYELKNYSGESGLRKSKLRDIFGLLPVFLIKRISPYLLKYKL